MPALLLTSSTPVAKIRKSPNVSHSHSIANAGQGELDLLVPCWSVVLSLHVSPNSLMRMAWMSRNVVECCFLLRLMITLEKTLATAVRVYISDIAWSYYTLHPVSFLTYKMKTCHIYFLEKVSWTVFYCFTKERAYNVLCLFWFIGWSLYWKWVGTNLEISLIYGKSIVPARVLDGSHRCWWLRHGEESRKLVIFIHIYLYYNTIRFNSFD